MLGSTPCNKLLLMASLTLKLMAWVGKYLRTFAQFPLQRDKAPSSLIHLEKQSPMPLYGFSLSLGLFYCVCNNNLTLSMGAAKVLAIAPEVPPRIKSLTILEVEFWLVEGAGEDA